MKLPSKELLIDILVSNCLYAQEHIGDPDAWTTDTSEREHMLQCTSYQAACYLSQNTVEGHQGVEWEIVADHLAKFPGKTEDQWREIFEKLIDDLGGFAQEAPAYTPGPWIVNPTADLRDERLFIEQDPNQYDCPRAIADVWTYKCKWAEADAKLIAQAPNLVQTLTDLIKAVELHKLKIKKDFGLINARAQAAKAVYLATGRNVG